MNGRYRHLLGSQGVEILPGQRWIRLPNVLKINNPLNIEIIAEPEAEEERFYVKDLSHKQYIFFYRDDIVSNYERKMFTGDIGLNEQICEIMGWRHQKDEDGDFFLASPKGKREMPDYIGSPMLSKKLLDSLSKFSPKFKVGMGKYTLYLDKPYRGSSKEEAICAAWIDKNS